MAINPLREPYERAKRQYHLAGKAAKGTPEGSPQRVAYEAAKRAYQEAGKALRESLIRAAG